ncbi:MULTISPECIES: NifB/NifX family molybdenum-iron cluster-binding protein [Metallosphaera]|uniref:Dinitrogenase iron-molybdenum cofactor biosynthesis domain-containing protein n=3 Tax=Metallosphaera TaxID=41980 RepID=A4YFQ1_METS5|nr:MULTISPECIES: hypothetical protein [Metallosphaera]ABP95253.1 hypothetical protein Msed_1089 [Metallosphaera sedula DSM 5348]AIM27239.1 hypothetical protein HA72_1089 [Metallosphaera sedula]AKV74128.1 hypothetical protein MsedA_1102 [Metallosphaera sedula]AKV76368.1 hypothetical protein MsedB_1104 [Metallosphaera sedula]AKV78619.1 hypothetical protein MsedC_1102 [Metallosphaera sedula]
MKICTVVDDQDRIKVFSKGKFLILFDDKNKEVMVREENPALHSPMKRPTVAKECVRLGANRVIAAHGSLCYPSYSILKRNGVEMVVGREGQGIFEEFRPVTMGEVMYSSLQAMWERVKGH